MTSAWLGQTQGVQETMTIARTLGTAVVAAFCASGAALAEKHNPDQNFNFRCGNCQNSTLINQGITNLNVTCYGQKSTDASSWSVDCKSPEVGIVCVWSTSDSYCNCNSDAPKAHTVNIIMDKHCTQPSSEGDG